MDRKMTKEEFDKWVLKLNNDFKNDKSALVCIFGIRTFVFHKSNPEKVGMSKCSKEDSFKPSVGTAIAYARYIGEEVPKLYETSRYALFSLSHGTHFLYNGERYVYLGRNPVLPNRNAVCYAIDTDEYVEFEDSLTIVDVIKE